MARRKVYRTPLQFEQEFAWDVRKMGETLIVALAREVLSEGTRLIKDGVPEDTGEMKDSIKSIVRERLRDPSAVTSLGDLQGLGVASTDKGFHAVDNGRQRQFYKKGGFSRMGGSPRAPRGMTKPAVEQLQGMASELQRRAIEAAEDTLA